ncbi:MAG: TOBE domain-containing protein [Pseudomonadota bacterium]
MAADAGQRLGLAPGRRGTLVVRPETVRFLAPGEEAEVVAGGRLVAEYALGSRHQYEVELADGRRLTAETLREGRLHAAIGDSVQVGWDLGACHLIAE